MKKKVFWWVSRRGDLLLLMHQEDPGDRSVTALLCITSLANAVAQRQTKNKKLMNVLGYIVSHIRHHDSCGLSSIGFPGAVPRPHTRPGQAEN